MKGKKFSEVKIMMILKEGEAGLPVLELCRKHGIGQAPISPGALSTGA